MNSTPTSSSSDNLLKFIAGCLIVLLVGGMLCVFGLGAGFLAGRYGANSAQPVAAAPTPISSETLPDAQATPISGAEDEAVPPAAEATQAAPVLVPDHVEAEDFGVFWEALNLLQDNFEGDIPAGEELTQAAIDGVEETASGCKDDDETIPAPIVLAPDSPSQAPEDFDAFWTAVNETYAACGIADPAVKDLPYAAFAGVTDRLGDDYTVLLAPQRAEQFRIDLDASFEGIGSTVNEAEGGGVTIVHPFPGSPAEQAGLVGGDIIVAVDGEDITGLTLDEAIQLIRGPAGTDVVLTIHHEGEETPFDITVTRDRIDIPVLESETTPEGILHVSLFDFSPRGGEELRQVLTKAVDDGVKGVILDLRSNPGGRLDVSIDIASMFIEDGVVVEEKGNRNFEHKAEGKAILPKDLPLAVLVDGGTASASEIVAGAIQDYGRGALIGETTFGKGSVQSLFDLSDGSLLRVTTAHWFTPKGRLIQGEGLKPDIEVPFDREAGDDNQLQAAIDYLLEQIKK